MGVRYPIERDIDRGTAFTDAASFSTPILLPVSESPPGSETDGWRSTAQAYEFDPVFSFVLATTTSSYHM